MKWYLLLTVTLIIGCKDELIIDPIKNEPCDPTPKDCNYVPARIHLPGEMLFGKVSGLKNCLPFEASAEAYLQNAVNPWIGVVFNTYEQLSIQANKEFVSIVAKTQGSPIGKWPLMIDTIPNLIYHEYYVYEDFHQLEDVYRIDNGYEDNYIEFCIIDSTINKIYGTFEARFITVGFTSHGKNPDTILFSNCIFEAWHPE